jgi:hypothetical protein
MRSAGGTSSPLGDTLRIPAGLEQAIANETIATAAIRT